MVTIDEVGGRCTVGENGSSSRPALPILGDSFTFGVGVEDDEAYPSLLETQLQRPVFNLGVPGTTLENHLDTVEMRHAELSRPKFYVFALFVGNDLTDLVSWHEGHLRGPGAASGSRRFLNGVNATAHRLRLNRSRLFRLVKDRAVSLVHPNGTALMESLFLVARLDSDVFERSAHYLEMALDRLTRLSHALGFDFAFILLPDMCQVAPEIATARAGAYGL